MNAITQPNSIHALNLHNMYLIVFFLSNDVYFCYKINCILSMYSVRWIVHCSCKEIQTKLLTFLQISLNIFYNHINFIDFSSVKLFLTIQSSHYTFRAQYIICRHILQVTQFLCSLYFYFAHSKLVAYFLKKKN